MGTSVIYEKPKKAQLAEPYYPNHFVKIKRHPLDPFVTPIKNICYLEEDLVQASLEVGYGPTDDLANIFTLSGYDAKAFANYYRKRSEWLLSGLDIANGVISQKSFKGVSETSDHGTESYYFGMIFGYLAFRAWLTPGLQLRRALHISTFTKGSLIKAGRQFRLLNLDSKCPDLLCEDDQGNWHIVEAKGGGEGYRYSAIRKALRQLDGISLIRDYASGNGAIKPKSSVCSYIQTASEHDVCTPWKLWIVDPAPTKKRTLLIHADLAELRLILTQELLISASPTSKKQHDFAKRPLKRSPIDGVLIQPMDDEMPHHHLRTQLARFEKLQRLVMSMQEPVLWLTSLDLIDFSELVSKRVRALLHPAELRKLGELLQLELSSIVIIDDTKERALGLARLLFQVLELDDLLGYWRSRRQAFHQAVRERILGERRGETVEIRPLTCGAIVVGFRQREEPRPE